MEVAMEQQLQRLLASVPDTLQPQKLLASVPDTLYQLGIGRTKLYELFESRDLVAVKIGGRTFVTQQSINEFVERLTAQPLK